MRVEKKTANNSFRFESQQYANHTYVDVRVEQTNAVLNPYCLHYVAVIFCFLINF